MSKKILLLSHCFSPYVFPESYLSAKKMGNLEGIEVDVWTVHASEAWVERDPVFFEQYVKNKFQSIRYFSAPAWYNKIFFSRFFKMLTVPDSYFHLNRLYMPLLKEIERYDAVITWSMYHSIHLLGLKIKKKYPNLCWIAHFSDPWSKNPFFPKKGFLNKINAFLEKRVFLKADSLCFTSDETVKSSLAAYPLSIYKKSVVIPHCFDETLYDPALKALESPFVISHVGHFYGARQPDSLLQALKILNKEQPSLMENIKIYFVGPSPNSMTLDPDQCKYIRCLGRVDYRTSLRIMQESSLLLVVDAPFEFSPFLPSKLVDYIGADKPIFGITPIGTSQKLIQEMGFLVGDPKDSRDIAEKLLQMIQGVKDKKLQAIPAHIRNRYSLQTVTRQMGDLFKKASTP